VQWPTIQCTNIPDGFSTSWLRNGMYEMPDIFGQSWLAEGVRLWMSQLFVRMTFLFHRMSKKYPPMFIASSLQVLKIRSSSRGLVMWLRDFHPLPLRVMRPVATPFRRFFRFVVRRSKVITRLLVCAGVVSGLLSAGVPALINHALHHPSDHSVLMMLGFLVLVVGKLLANICSQLLLVRFSEDTTLDLSLSLCAKIVYAPLMTAFGIAMC
jgi:hypothetical protein